MTETWLTNPPQDELQPAIGDKFRLVLSTAMEAATIASYRRAEQLRGQAAETDADQRRLASRQDAEYDADRLIWRQAWNERWWQRATPEQIARAWEASATWAGLGFPAARATAEHMRAEIARRYGIDTTGWDVPPSGLEVARLLAAHADPAGEAGETDPPFADPDRPVSYRIRDTRDGSVAATGTAYLDPDDGPGLARLLAADRLRAHERAHEAAHPGEPGGFVVDLLYTAEPSGTPAETLDAAAAARLDDARRRIAAAQPGDDALRDVAPDDLIDALTYERHRLGAELRGHLHAQDPARAAREHLATWRNARGLTPPPGSAAGSAAKAEPPGAADLPDAERAERIIDLRRELFQIGLRLEAARAEQRGENGDQVIAAAALRRELDDGWWQTATPFEIAAVWGHVRGWSPGQARDAAIGDLRARIFRHHDIDIGRDAAPLKVAQEVHRGRAQARGEQVYTYRIEPPDRPDGAAATPPGYAAAGRTTAPRDLPAGEVARRLLSAHPGGLAAARRQRFQVMLGDHEGRPIATVPAAELPDGPASREAEQRWRHAREHDAAARRADAAGDRFDYADPAAAAGERGDAAAHRDAAASDRSAAAAAERTDLSQPSQTGDAGMPGGAARTAAKGFPTDPRTRLGRAGRRGRTGPSRVTRTRGLGHRPGQPPGQPPGRPPESGR